ncbi:hypothetical protein [Bacillus safensis]|uniref:hypothetical protein n=1 Tax=Bacillus safensis TaxID=561879 RepID=UPI00227D9BCB|nr:hypothetical protein [Bacillus safensis]MCY7472166.1 hypothetical protein [Bacillus safensis]MCY7509168.1 hypothetical protein [Bacillus safensis]MCY7516889.1 hypothetical protein [Bacillus safensis]MEC1078198.1 hypothetical protein [Bacillus safensis]MED4705873.1 hypothetical protein [Bacillus safensis]
MVLKTPRSFEISDKAHADLFNKMIQILIENDTELLAQIYHHAEDTNPHVSDSEKKKWNESQLYKLTNDNGSHLINIPAGGSIYEGIKALGACSFYAPGGSGVVDSPAVGNAALRGFQLVGQNNIGVGIAIDTLGNAFYFSYYVKDIGINWVQMPTQNEKNKWDAGQLSKITADDGKAFERINADDPSILDKLIKLPGVHSWYIHEAHPDLPTRSSMRALSVFSENTYGWVIGANNTGDVYINRSTTDVTGTQQEWSGWKRLNDHNLLNSKGLRLSMPIGTDILTLPSGFYFAVGSNVLNMPVDNDSSWFNIDILETVNGRKTIHIIRSYDNTHWFGTVHTDGVFKGWKKIVTDADFESVKWLDVTLANGSSIGDRPVQYVKWGNLLLLRGHLIANREVICGSIPNTGLPDKGIVVSVPVSGTTGHSKLYIYKTGELKLTGLHAVNNSGVTGYYLDTVVPLN